jgi:hypothetical protein
MVKKVNNSMKKLLLLAIVSITQTACAHPHYVVPARRYVCPPPPVAYYDYSARYPYYYNDCYNYSYGYGPRYYVSPGIDYGFTFNNGRSFGRIRIR